MSPPFLRTDATPWEDAVRHCVQDGLTGEELAWDRLGDIERVLSRLIGSGRCVAYVSQGEAPPTGQLLQGLETRTLRSPMANPWSRDAAPDDPAAHLLTLVSDGAAPVLLVPARLTYLPGPDLAHCGFHLQAGNPQPAAAADRVASLAKNRGIVFVDAAQDLSRLLRSGATLDELDGLLEAFATPPRASFQPISERLAQEKLEAAIRERYQRAKGPKPGRLTQADIDVIVEAALDHGVVPSLKLVHAVTAGRGSPNQVYPKIADAMARIAPARRATPADIHPGFWEAWQALKEAADTTVRAALEPERQALRDAREAAAAEQAALAARAEALARAQADREQALSEAVAANEQLTRLLADQQAAAAATHAALRQALDDAQAVHATERQQLTGARDQARDAVAQAEVERARLVAAQVELSAAQANTERQWRTLQQDHAALGQEVQALHARVNDHVSELAERAATIERLTTHAATQARTIGSLEARLHEREHECIQLRPLTAQLQQTQQALARLEGQHEVLAARLAAAETKRPRFRGATP